LTLLMLLMLLMLMLMLMLPRLVVVVVLLIETCLRSFPLYSKGLAAKVGNHKPLSV
jgi:hypothetical protein